MTGLDVHRTLPIGLPDDVIAAFTSEEWAGRTCALVALKLGPARQRATLHLALAQSFLRTGERKYARDHLIQAEAISRSQRLARSLRLDIALTFSLLARQEGQFTEAINYARQVQRCRACGAALLGAAYLASATAQRLAGDALAAIQDVHTAAGFIAGEELETARLLTWLAARPQEVDEAPAARMPELSAPLRARLAWTLAEQALAGNQPVVARTWIDMALRDPASWEERRLTPLAAAYAAKPVPTTSSEKAAIKVLTLGPQGLLIRERFVPVPGDGAPLAILALLIQRGACHLPDLASLILEPEPNDLSAAQDPQQLAHRLSMQVRRHLNTIRRLLADPECVQTVRGIVDLSSDRKWTCDALTPDARPLPGRAWLPHLPGSWVSEQRQRLASSPGP
ncbi:hypothetical protein MF271_00690 (plasmid) [Deinococcus sp. KNUC1210]|uniref:hypothetical protein n=1 Tax=Deinococcus sp. KNUC1210 TaxID=2917691 RepID=UPI001EF07EB4|nr:hypothetical protein [Deinococcus sp. KNUC1210]ULH14029.1 hypothetical protein MF271_00690 [Deinococcus sp. KNUC1210]